MSNERNCITYWLPKLQAAGIRVPKTEIVRIDAETHDKLFMVLDGKDPGDVSAFFAELALACDKIGYPCFLRTGQGSGKHGWKDTCYIQDASKIPSHVYGLIEWSECVDFMGLPWNVWAVRELLPTTPICTLPAYGDFPLVPEARVFVRDGKIQCAHPYWPRGSVEEGFPPKVTRLSFEDEGRLLPDNIEEIVARVHDLDVSMYRGPAQAAAEAFAGNGGWSVDILPTKRGWFVTDMAVAEESFHWPECEFSR